MSSVVVLVGAEITETLSHAAQAITSAAGGSCGTVRRVESDCIEFDCDGFDDEPMRRALAEALIEAFASVDVFVVARVQRVKRLLLADMDSTIIQEECIDELADFAGVRAQVAEVTERAMRGELDFVQAIEQRVALLAGLSVDVLADCYQTRIHVMPGARELVAGMKRAGADAVLISGGFTFFVERVARDLGFDAFYANELGITNGQLDGTVRVRVDRAAKAEALHACAAARGLSPADVLAIGDGANDIDMITAAGCGVAYRAKPALSAAARHRIVHADLRAVLQLQGL